MADSKIGRVTHYYDKIGVAVVELTGDLKKGDKIRFVRGGEDLFEQEVGSMEVEHEKVDQARSGDVVGLGVTNKVKDAAEVYKID